MEINFRLCQQLQFPEWNKVNSFVLFIDELISLSCLLFNLNEEETLNGRQADGVNPEQGVACQQQR